MNRPVLPSLLLAPPSGLARAAAALCCAALVGCAQVDQASPLDGGVGVQPQVADVQPQPGPVAASARFHLAFSQRMDDSLLLVDANHSETVVLVRAADADVVASALSHGKLTTRLRALLLAAHAAVDPEARAIDLTPDQPLPAGEIFLLVASRLKDAAGRKLLGNGARFGYVVQEAVPLPRLVSPRPGSEAALNLSRVRLEVPAGAEGVELSLAGPAGPLWSGAAPDAGPLAAALCPGAADCGALQAGATYSLQLGGQPLQGTAFTAAGCRKEAPPVVLSAQAAARDDRIEVEAAFDGPLLARLEVATEPADGGDADALLTRLCGQGACRAAEASVSCVRGPCGGEVADGGAADPCTARLEVGGLEPETRYLLRLRATDDEGHAVQGPAQRLATSALLPHVVVSEVMSWPGPPVPQHRGQYVELLNVGAASVDLSALALQGADGKARPLSAAAAGPIELPPGRRALAVGSLFDSTRYPELDPAVPVLRAATKRLLGRGLKESGPAAFSLVLVRGGAANAVLDSFPGGTACSIGESLERSPQDALPGQAAFLCGASGGSPGRPP